MYDVVVIGGGIAGLAAARRLGERGAEVVVVEGRTRLGGRMHTLHGDGWPAPREAGAEFVHGRDPTLMRALRRAGLHADRAGDGHWLRRRGELVDDPSLWERVMPLLREEADVRRDRSIRARIDSGGADAETRDFLLAYVEGFHAAPPARASARAISDQQDAADAIHGDEARRVREGYGALVGWMAAGIDARLGATVEAIGWRRGQVRVTLRSSLGWPLPAVVARQAVVTLPLGVLQGRPGAAAVRFAPPLPVEKRRAIAALGMGDVVKVAFRFGAPLWREHERRLGELAFMHGRGLAVPTWWRPLPFRGPMLVGWAGGPAAARLGGHPPQVIARRAAGALARMLGLRVQEVAAALAAWEVFDWRADPFSAGAYSWTPVGALAAPAALAAPVAATLFFAGEATHAAAGGTVHGALASGLRAAAEIADVGTAPALSH